MLHLRHLSQLQLFLVFIFLRYAAQFAKAIRLIRLNVLNCYLHYFLLFYILCFFFHSLKIKVTTDIYFCHVSLLLLYTLVLLPSHIAQDCIRNEFMKVENAMLVFSQLWVIEGRMFKDDCYNCYQLN